MRAAKQKYRVGLDEEDVCSPCGGEGEGVRVEYHVSRGPGQCQDVSSASVTLTMDQASSVTHVRARRRSWLTILAGLGGLWSLLTGVSLVSLLELGYWLVHTFYNHIEVSKDDQEVNEQLGGKDPGTEDGPGSRPRSAWSDDIPEETNDAAQGQEEETSDEEESAERPVSVRARPKSAWRAK